MRLATHLFYTSLRMEGTEGKCKFILYVVGRDMNIMTTVKLLSIISEGTVVKQ
jgi:hypothetical protein